MPPTIGRRHFFLTKSGGFANQIRRFWLSISAVLVQTLLIPFEESTYAVFDLDLMCPTQGVEF